MYDMIRLITFLSKTHRDDIHKINDDLRDNNIDIRINRHKFPDMKLIRIGSNSCVLCAIRLYDNIISFQNYSDNSKSIRYNFTEVDIKNYTDEELVFLHGKNLTDESLKESHFLSPDIISKVLDLSQNYN